MTENWVTNHLWACASNFTIGSPSLFLSQLPAVNPLQIEFPGLGEGRLFDPHARDGVTEPFIYLRDRLRDLGFELRTADDEPVADVAQVWFWNFPATHRERGVGEAR